MISPKCVLVSLCFLGLSHPVDGQDLSHIWSQRFGDAWIQDAWSAAVDASGNVIVVGDFGGTVDFGGGPLTSLGDWDMFVVKFGPTGNHLWSKRFGDASVHEYQEGYRAAVDETGNVIVTGGFEGAVDFGGGPLTSAGSVDIFVVKFDPDGNHVWSKRFGDASLQFGYGVAAGGSGDVIVVGDFVGTVAFGGDPLTSAGIWDIYVAKFDASGDHLWSKRFGDADGQAANAVAVDGSGNVIVTGDFNGTVDFGGGALTSSGDTDIFVVKFDPDGNHVWSKRFGDALYQVGYRVAVDASGNVIVTGDFQGTVNFGGGPLTGVGEMDIYVVKLDANGNHLWSKRFGDANDQWAESVAVDGSGSVIVAGYFHGTVDFGGDPLGCVGDYDIYVVKLDANGNHLWSKRFGDANVQWASSAAVDAFGNLLVTGAFGGTVDFGGGLLLSAGNRDIFVAKFADIATGISSMRIGNTLRLDAYPNPFNPVTAVTYFVPNLGLVDLRIYDVEGRLIRTLVRDVRDFGEHTATWDGLDGRGVAVSSGIFFVRLEAGGQVATRKIAVLK